MLATEPRVSAPPTFFYVPEGARFTWADEIADLAEAVGYQMDEPERATCRALYPQAVDGSWIGLESGIVGPRQNLKTAMMIAGALHDTFVQGVERVIWTAHEFKTSSDAFNDFQAIIEGHDWLASEVLAVRTSNGKEGFDLRNGSRLDVMARTGKSGRGMGTPRLYLDEGLYLTGRMMGAIVPVVSARRNPHIVHGSSPGLVTSDVLRELRQRGRSGIDPNLGWIEWSNERQPCRRVDCTHTPGTPGCWLDDMDAVLRVNPAIPRRISVEYIEQERLALSSAPVEWLRERMGVWEDPPPEGVDQVIPAEAWASRLDEDSTIPDGARVAFAVDTSWDRQTTWIAVAGLRADGVPHIEVVATHYGSEWVEGWLDERLAKWNPVAIGLQGTGAPVSSIAEPLKQKFGDVIASMTGQDLGRACGNLFDAVASGPLAHVGQEQLEQSVRMAAIRASGDSWLWDRKASPVDIAPLVAVTEALYLLKTTPDREPKKPGRLHTF
jgi:hypothetical protein